tara:strand:- start:773 stop:955 length:183 start_codon:yes stop_codon:yes gene_type:complete
VVLKQEEDREEKGDLQLLKQLSEDLSNRKEEVLEVDQLDQLDLQVQEEDHKELLELLEQL